MIWPILSAILGIIAFLPANIYPAIFIFLVPLFFFFLQEKKLWRLIAGAFLFRLIFFFGTIYFTLEPILWMSSLLLFLGLPVSVFLFKKFINQTTSILPTLIFLPFAWTFFDLIQANYSLIPGYVITAGNALGSSPFLGLASLGGLVMLTFFVVMINTLIATLVFERKNRKHIIFLTVTTTLLILFAWCFSIFELQKNTLTYNTLPNSITVAAVFTNETFTLDSLGKITQELANRKVDFIVFPADIFNQSVTIDFKNNFPLLGNNSTLMFQNLAKELHTNILAAYDTLQGTPTLKYNSTILFNSEGNVTDIHNKSRLVFLGEYWPFGDWYPSIYDWLKKQNPRISNFAIFNQKNADRVGERNIFSTTFQGKTVLFAVPICLEIHYPYDLKEYRSRGARFLINQSSSRWADIGAHHFLYLTDNLKKIEAVWLKLPIISSGVNETAGIILPNGQMQIINYENGNKNNKNYEIFFGEVRY